MEYSSACTTEQVFNCSTCWEYSSLIAHNLSLILFVHKRYSKLILDHDIWQVFNYLNGRLISSVNRSTTWTWATCCRAPEDAASQAGRVQAYQHAGGHASTEREEHVGFDDNPVPNKAACDLGMPKHMWQQEEANPSNYNIPTPLYLSAATCWLDMATKGKFFQKKKCNWRQVRSLNMGLTKC